MHIHILTHTYPHINTYIHMLIVYTHIHTHPLIKDQRPQRDEVISPKGPAAKGNKHKSQLSANEPWSQAGAIEASCLSRELLCRDVERGPDLS